MRKAVTIIAPHPDDEIIGCYEVLRKSGFNSVWYIEKVSENREKDALTVPDMLNVSTMDFFRGDYDRLRQRIIELKKEKLRYYFPDPVYETHPAHRVIGAIGEEFLRKGWDVVFYSINMQTPYIHEVKNKHNKEKCLDWTYRSQKSLWQYEKKYVFFEGYCKWII